MMRKVVTTDGYVFWQQPDGTLTDNPDPEKADLTYTNLEELQESMEVEVVD